VASIDGAISDSGEITGSFTKEETDALSLALRTGALPATITYLDTRTVGPSLGAASIRQGVIASVTGMTAVMIFMLIYYKGSGINADLALLLNLLILLGFMGYSHATLTLPGIAGVILTIGMGVDSNVLIFERIREELRAGKTAAAAVKEGFGHAWITIVDTHVTTIVSAAILFLFGTGPIKGFAVTLVFGLLANLFTAVYVSRLIFESHLKGNGQPYCRFKIVGFGRTRRGSAVVSRIHYRFNSLLHAVHPPRIIERNGTLQATKRRLAGQEVVFPGIFSYLFGRRSVQPPVLAPCSAGRRLQGRNPHHHQLQQYAE
jgi:protein-export SecD/SecF family membrane protein